MHFMPDDKGLHVAIKEAWGQEAVAVAAILAPLPEVEARPDELVASGDDDPGAFVIKAEICLTAGGISMSLPLGVGYA